MSKVETKEEKIKTKKVFYSLYSDEVREVIRVANITNDLMFKELYFKDNDVSKRCREDLIVTFMEEYRVFNSCLLNEGFMNKDTTVAQRYVDGACKVNDQDIFVFEIQKQKPENGFDRFIAYGSGIVEYRVSQNESYSYGKNIVILFTCFPLSEDLMKHSSHVVHRTSQNVVVSELITLIIVPLHGLEHLFQKPVDELSKKERYCLWLAHRHEEKYQSKMKEIIEKEEGLQMAEAVLNDIRNSRKAFTDIMNKYYIISERMESERKDQLIKEAKKETEHERKLRLEAEQKANIEKRKADEAEQKANIEKRKADEGEQKANLEKRKADKALRGQKILNYTIELMTQGYSINEARKLAEEKYQN